MNKRFFDLICSCLGLLLLFPIFFVIFFLIKLTSRGPAFFKQKRVGKEGKLFILIKFRTMYISHANKSTISIKGDNRVTPIGRFLRKYKLDELPELWNVIRGDMSFVGPRPDVPGYADNLEGEDRLILKLKPGITGPASLKYANEEVLLARQSNPQEYNDNVIYPDKVSINLEYYHNNNLLRDIKIIFASIFRVNY